MDLYFTVRQLQLREVRSLAPGHTVGGGRASSTQLAADLFTTTMLLLSVNEMICEECLACSWLDLNLTQPVVFTKRLVGAFWGPEKMEVGIEKRLVSLSLCSPTLIGVSSMNAGLGKFGSRLMTIFQAQQEAERRYDTQGHRSFCEFVKSSAGSDLVMDIVIGQSLGSLDFRGHLRNVIRDGALPTGSTW